MAQAPAAHHYHIEIRPTGKKNPASQGTEVWVVRFEGKKYTPAAEIIQPAQGWFTRDGSVVTIGQGSTLVFDGDLPEADRLGFLAHPWSGIAEVAINGRSRTLDLYAATSSSAYVDLGLPSAAPAASASTSVSAPTASSEGAPPQYLWYTAAVLVLLGLASVISLVLRTRKGR
jgi:hypothetical protein